MEETFDYLPEAMLDPGGPLLWIRHLVAGDGYHELTIAPSFDTAVLRILLETTAYQVTPSFSAEDERAYRVHGMGYWRSIHWAELSIEDAPHLYARSP